MKTINCYFCKNLCSAEDYGNNLVIINCDNCDASHTVDSKSIVEIRLFGKLNNKTYCVRSDLTKKTSEIYSVNDTNIFENESILNTSYVLNITPQNIKDKLKLCLTFI